MSHETQQQFRTYVRSRWAAYNSQLKLDAPRFNESGFISTATMTASGGRVELTCGPAEYHVDIAIITDADQRVWDLSDLMVFNSVERWLHDNKLGIQGKSRLHAEVEQAFNFIANGLSGLPEFSWLYR